MPWPIYCQYRFALVLGLWIRVGKVAYIGFFVKGGSVARPTEKRFGGLKQVDAPTFLHHPGMICRWSLVGDQPSILLNHQFQVLPVGEELNDISI